MPTSVPTPRPLGLALGGGAALGAAHVGVLRVLAAHGIRPDVVTGTSAGALVGAAIAAELAVDTIEEQVRAATWSTFGRFTLAPRLGLLDSTALAASVGILGRDPAIEDLPRRFAAIATAVRTRRAIALTRGSLTQALRASIAVPGIFPPITIDGQTLVDGGIADNLPIAVARDLGARTVIAVRLRGEWEWPLLRTTTATTTREAAGDPDILLIEPDLRGLAQWSRADVPRLIDAGRVAAEQALAAHPITPGSPDTTRCG